MISRSLILLILQAAKIMRRFFYEAPAEIMRNYTTFPISFCNLQNQLEGKGALYIKIVQSVSQIEAS